MKQPSAGEFPLPESASAALERVLESASRLQRLVPDAVLVGGSAVAAYVGHRDSTGHDHVLASLQRDYDMVLDALEREGDFVFAKGVPGKIILGELGGIEVGVRQLMRERPLEVQQILLPSGHTVTVPTKPEILRIKAFLMVKRNQVRDYLDVAALSDALGAEAAGAVLREIDSYYADPAAADGERPVLTQLRRQLADPSPKDTQTLARLPRYKNLAKRWHSWGSIREECVELSIHL